MSKAARSLFVFSLYLFGLGLVILILPNTLLGLFGLPPTNEVWIRLVGMMLLILVPYYMQAVRHELLPIIQLSVYVRSSVILFFLALVSLGLASPLLILFGIIDLLGAIWTWVALRSSSETQLPRGGAHARRDI
jgi:hypothetical protein